MTQPAIIFANGFPAHGQAVQRVLEAHPNRCIIAADGGANLAYQEYQLIPHIIIGDMDSTTTEQQAFFQQHGSVFHVFPPEKDETDLELALLYARQHGHNPIFIIGAFGNRFDQTLGNVYLLALPALAGHDVRLVGFEQQLWLVGAGEHTIHGAVGDTLSLLPFSARVSQVHTHGLYYPLNGEDLLLGYARGMSNVFTQTEVTIHFTAGSLVLIHTQGRA
ncbi:MAG: thiamine diphosphokinase [Phototrophicaceae bacterium]